MAVDRLHGDRLSVGAGGAPPRDGGFTRDGGFATVWAAGAVMVLVTLLVFILHLAAATSSRHRAEAAADLGALAAAAHAFDGAAACAQAARVAEGMDALSVSCRLSGWEAFVEVTVSPSPMLPLSGPAYARARAGPADW